MCIATRFPEVIPLRKITASSVLKALTNFFAVFCLPVVVQTDQGSNFQFKMFTQALGTLKRHSVSSMYHPVCIGMVASDSKVDAA